MAASTHRILLIRHAEIAEEPPPLTTDEHGRPDTYGLLPRGWQRAGALPHLFTGAHPALPAPTRLIAPGRGAPQPDKARRMAHTLAPLSRLLGLAVAHPADEGQEDDLAEHVLRLQGGVTLICWGHTFIPQLARRLTSQAVPREWPDDRFDLLWSFETKPPESSPSYEQLPQQLLADDSVTPIATDE